MKKFEEPIIEIIKFVNSDVITTSYTGGGTIGDLDDDEVISEQNLTF